jgi:MFS family permease
MAAGAPGRRVAYRRLLLCRTAVGVFLAGFGAYWVIALNITWLANYLVRALNLPPDHAAWIVGLSSVLQMLLAPVLAWLSQTLSRRGWSTRLSRGVLGALCVVTSGVAMICMCLLQFGVLKVCLIGLSFSVGSVIFTLGSTLIGEIAPPVQRGAMLGITNSVQTLAGLCAPLVMGQIIDWEPDTATGFRAGFILSGGLVAALGILAAVLIDPAADKRRLS